MKTQIPSHSSIILACRAALCGLAAATPALAADQPITEGRNHFSLGGHALFNVSVSFENTSGQSALGPAAGNQVDRFYDDGFVGVDSAGNAANAIYPEGSTWYWSYHKASQATATALDFHSAAPSSGKTESDSDVGGGFNFTYGRDLGTLGRNVRWGIEAAFSYSTLSFDDDAAYSGMAQVTTDRYRSTLGAPPPRAPGVVPDKNVAGPLIASIPTRSVSTESAYTTGWRELEANIFGLRLGPYVSIPLGKRFALLASAGLAMAFVDADLDYAETTTTRFGAVNRSGSGGEDDFVIGGYVGLQASYAISPNWSVFLGGQFQSMGESKHGVGSKEAAIDLGTAFLLQGGVGYSF